MHQTSKLNAGVNFSSLSPLERIFLILTLSFLARIFDFSWWSRDKIRSVKSLSPPGINFNKNKLLVTEQNTN